MELKNLILAMAIATPLFVAGCDTSDGPAEEAGESIDNAVDKAGENIEDAGDELKEEMNR